ncbi:indoleamine 2,3-dioxygenase [Henriciella barbarensis]|uniref:Indoleamine 2,3-dioxygenase n=1 Tax=Henriciella barbarensis TaxID=86342 RepID=A0A399QU19_9PROT|nr:indoleamine 2,3-dioxygenase [Henriciella barbarensis]RIJ22293.1 indoleamine 2,3-dioxygenase [Henriciella barbarensis]
MPKLKPLDQYDISRDRGFLCRYDAGAVTLPAELQPAVDAAMALPHSIVTGRVREILARLPVIDLTRLCKTATDEQIRKAFVHYTFMIQSWVWGEREVPTSLPECLAKPAWQLADTLDSKPLLTYATYVLDNWAKVDADGPVDLSNVYMTQPFLSGGDEAWFVLVHVAIEARAGDMLATIPEVIDACDANNATAVAAGLKRMSEGWDAVNAIFDRMPERCDPYIYFNRVRPYIHGWKDNPALGDGLIYEGVPAGENKPQAFRGQTGSQSSIVPTMDAFLSISHADDPLRHYLEELHAYRPTGHRAFIEDVRAASTLRDWVSQHGDAATRQLYNDNVMKLARFRTRHLEYAATYINKQAGNSPGNDTDVGTGGTPFMKYLKKHRDEAEAHLLDVEKEGVI